MHLYLRIGLIAVAGEPEAAQGENSVAENVSDKQLLSLLVRVLGVIVALDGASHVLSTVCSFWVWPYDLPRNFPIPSAIPELPYGLGALVLGAAMIRRPGFVVRIAQFEAASPDKPSGDAMS